MVTKLLEATRLSKSFGARMVLRDASLGVNEGETLVLIGPSGSGKTTLLRCLNWLETPDSGAILLRGESIGRDTSGRALPEAVLSRQRSRIGFVFQRFNLFAHLSALDNVAMGPHRVLNLSLTEARERAHGELARVHLAEHVDKRPSQLSGGQQQRVAIARALAMRPDLILLDEPTSALDPELVTEVVDVMRELAASGMTMVAVTHEMRFARSTADRIIFMDDGMVVEQGSPDKIFDAPEQERNEALSCAPARIGSVGMTPFDLLLTEARLVTVDAAMTLIERGAIGVLKGRIAWIGPMESLPVDASATRRLSLAGRVLTPGLVNVHTHAVLSMVRGVAEDLGFAPAYTPGIPHGHDVRPDEAVALARLGAVEALGFGSTLINDSYVHADLTLPAMADLGGRVYGCGRIHDADFSLIGDGRWEYQRAIGERTLDEALRLADRWHGKFDGRTGVQLAAHAPDTCSDALLRDIAHASERTGLRVNIHLAQSRKEVDQVLLRCGRTPPQVLDEVGLLNERLLAAHCLFLSDEDIARCGRAGIHVAHIPKGNATGGTRAPSSALRRAGARFALGTDNMHADMVEVMRWALAMGRLQETAVNDFWQPQDVLRMATIEGARAMGLEHEIGSLELGKRADMVAFDFRRPHLVPCVNPVGNLVHVGQGRDVEHVWVDGVQVIEAGRPTLTDLDTILQDAQNASAALWQRAQRGQ